jgi:hypothetical protein
MPTHTWQESEYCLDVYRATDGAHNETYWAHKKLCEVRRLNIYQFLQ